MSVLFGRVAQQITRPAIPPRTVAQLVYDLHLSRRALLREPPSPARELGLEAISLAVRALDRRG